MIDVHAHYLPSRLLEQAARGELAGVTYDPESRIVGLPDGPSRPVPEHLSDLSHHDSWCTQRRIHLQVLSPWLDIVGEALDAEAGTAWTRAMNDALAHDIDGRVEYAGFAALPMSDGRAAAAELRRCVAEHKFLGAAIPTQVMGVNLEDAGLEPLFETAAELGAVLFVHPHRVLGADRMRHDFLNNVCGNPFETTLAALGLFLSGTFDRLPGLKVLLSHCGGTLPIIAGRAWQASRAGKTTRRTIESPDEILECFHYDTVVHDHGVLAFALARLDHDRIHLGTDLPFPMQVDDPVELIRSAITAVGEDAHAFDHITRTNPARLLGLA